jgi:hypothetical protein
MSGGESGGGGHGAETRRPPARRAGRVHEMNRLATSDRWRRFLAADAAGRDSEAELELAQLFAALPALRPAAGFADRVLAAALAGAARRSPFARRAVRWSLAVALLVAAAGAGLLAPMLPGLSRLVGPGELVGGLVELLSSATVRFAAGVALWQPIAGAAESLTRVVANPAVLSLLALHLLLAALALKGLAALATQGSTRHVAS